MIKLVAIDVDGTLLNSKESIDEKTKESIKKLNESGVKTVLTSGRVVSSLEYLGDILGFDNPMVGNNGAIIKLSKDKLYKSYPMDDELLARVIDFCKAHDFAYHFYDQDTFYSDKLTVRSLNHLAAETLPTGTRYQCDLVVAKDPIKIMKQRGHMANKVLIKDLENHRYGIKKSEEIIIENLKEDLYVTSSGYQSLEVMAPHVNKWEAVLELSQYLGINKEEIAAIGDSMNDLPMIRNSNLSFAMGNAHPSVKEIAKYTVNDNDSFGISQAAEIILTYNKENPSV